MVGCLAHWVVGITAEGGATLGWHEHRHIHLHAVMACGVLGKAMSAFAQSASARWRFRCVPMTKGPNAWSDCRAHILPTGAKRIRHYGVLASACKGVKLAAARLALQTPAASPQAIESAQAFMARVTRMDVGLCPCCKVGRLRTLAVLAGLAGLGRLPGPACTVAPHSRGPP